VNFPDIPAGWVTIIAALVVGGGSWLAARLTFRSSEPLGVKLITETTLSLIEPLTEKVEQLEREVEGLEVELRVWRELAERRGRQVTEYGGTPVRFEDITAEWGGLNKDDPS